MDAVNQGTQRIAVFGPDPHNRRYLNLLTRQLGDANGYYTHTYGPSEITPGRFHPGYAHNPQNYHGFAVATGGSLVPYRTGAYPMTDSGIITGPLGDVSRRVFAERLARRRPGGV
jgi:hypothetical protein